MTTEANENDIVGRECRFAVHIPSKNINEKPDLHLIKEVVHYKDGTTKPNIRYLKNYQRPYYITKPSFRNHQQKKEEEYLDRLLVKTTTQSQLRYEIAKAFEKPWSTESLKELSASPYLYGTDISSTSLIKYQYMSKYPNLVSAYSVCTFDVETDVINGTNDIIMATVCFKDQCFTSVIGNFVNGFAQVDHLFNECINKYIKEYIDKHQMTPILHIAKDPVDLLKTIFNKVHEWQPDFLAIWNMNFDIPKVLEMLKKYHIDPRDVLCDPNLPKEYQICQYKQGPNKKVTASGKVIPINPASQWHTLINTASFYVIDGMCAYKQIRLAKQEEPSYSLDAILNKELGIRKLKFKEADQYQRLKWHQFMQTYYKIEYIIYNIFDSLSMLELDEKTLDLRLTLPSYAGITDFSEFKSQPRKIADALYHFCLERGRVLGTVGKARQNENIVDEELAFYNEDEDEEDLETLNLKNWIN